MVGGISRRSVIGTSTAGLATLLAGCFGSTDPPWEGGSEPDVEGREIPLGVLSPQTGPLETLGQEVVDGARLVGRQLDAAAEIGYSIDLAVRDTEADADMTVEAAQDLADEGYEALIGPGTSESAAAVVRDVVVPESLVMMNPLAPTALLDVSDENRFYSTAPRGRRIAVALARPIAVDRVLSVGMIVEDNDYGQHISELTTEELRIRGTDVLTEHRLQGDGTDDLDTVLAETVDADPEGILIGTGPETGRRLLERYYDGDYPDVKVYLGDRLRLPDLPDTVGDPMENARVISLRPRWHISRYRPTRGNGNNEEPGDDAENNDEDDGEMDIDVSPAVLDNFFHAFEAEYDRTPTIQAAQAYDATVLLLLAALRSGEDGYDGTTIRDNIRRISNQQEGVPGVRNDIWDDWWFGVDAIADGVHNNYLGASSDCQFFETGELDSPAFHSALFRPEEEFRFEELQQIPT